MKHLKLNRSKIRSYQNLWTSAKAVLKENVIALHVYLINEKSGKINDLISHL